jgi:orotidine-5'-phosphate decarboxylase
MMTQRTVDNPLCVALDARGRDAIERTAALTEPHVGLFKVGLTAYAANGPAIVSQLVERKPVFLDLKLHDIPTQVAGAVRGVADLGIRYVTVHAAGGRDMVRAAVDAAGDRVGVLGVTVLSSLDDEVLEATGVRGPAETQVLRLAGVAVQAGAVGIVCSAHEVAPVRSRFGSRADGGPVLAVPGIRPDGAGRGDQRRTMAPGAALKAGADIVVVGRPITDASDPRAAARRIAEELSR